MFDFEQLFVSNRILIDYDNQYQ